MISARARPATSTTLVLDAAPRAKRSDRFGTPSAFANVLMSSSFAAPSTGGAASDRSTERPSAQRTQDVFARGFTRTVRRTTPFVADSLRRTFAMLVPRTGPRWPQWVLYPATARRTMTKLGFEHQGSARHHERSSV
jgi:hypothetical protein